MIVLCGTPNRGLEEFTREEALDLVEKLLEDGAHVQGCSVQEFAKDFGVYIEDPKDSLTHGMVQDEIIRLYANYVNRDLMPDFVLMDAGEEDENVGWLVLGGYDKWSIEVRYNIDTEEVWWDGGFGLSDYFKNSTYMEQWRQDIMRIAFQG